jgi:hypothetical protein
MKCYFGALFTLLLVCGCGGPTAPTPLEQAISQLKPGMSKAEVKQVFASCHVIGETNAVLTSRFMTSMTKYYSTNRESASRVVFTNGRSDSQSCAVYFNSNEVIVAHYFISGD